MKPRYMSPGFDQDDTKGLPLFAGLGGCDATVPEVAKLEAAPTPFDPLVKKFEDVEFKPDPIREVIVATPLTVEQADALRRGEIPPIKPGDKIGDSKVVSVGEKPVRLIDGKVRGTAEEPRLSAQCQKILDRLKEGPATNKELASLSLKYTGRISDLRASGFDVQVIERDRVSGVTRYALMESR